MCPVVIEYDNDKVKITEGEDLIAVGSGKVYQRLAQNTIDRADENGYNVKETFDGHKKIVMLVEK